MLGSDPPPPRHGRYGSPSPNPPPGTATKEGEGGVGQMGFRAIPPPQSNFLPALPLPFCPPPPMYEPWRATLPSRALPQVDEFNAAIDRHPNALKERTGAIRNSQGDAFQGDGQTGRFDCGQMLEWPRPDCLPFRRMLAHPRCALAPEAPFRPTLPRRLLRLRGQEADGVVSQCWFPK